MVSAHLNGQIFASIGICPYCLMGEEGSYILRYVTLLRILATYDAKIISGKMYQGGLIFAS